MPVVALPGPRRYRVAAMRFTRESLLAALMFASGAACDRTRTSGTVSSGSSSAPAPPPVPPSSAVPSERAYRFVGPAPSPSASTAWSMVAPPVASDAPSWCLGDLALCIPGSTTTGLAGCAPTRDEPCPTRGGPPRPTAAPCRYPLLSSLTEAQQRVQPTACCYAGPTACERPGVGRPLSVGAVAVVARLVSRDDWVG